MKNITLQQINHETYESLRTIPGTVSLLGSEEPDTFWRGRSRCTRFLIASDDYHLTPSIINLEDGNRFVAGVQEMFFLIADSEIQWKTPIPCLFYRLVLAGRAGFFLRHEIGFCLVTWRGSISWEAGSDLFTDWFVLDNRICMKTLEGDVISAVLPSEVDPNRLQEAHAVKSTT